jgi:uncharacterized tellurite resistance protein B-like protein
VSHIPSRTEEDRKNALKACVGMAFTDGHLSESEFDIIKIIGTRMGCSVSEMRECFDSPTPTAIPGTRGERALNLIDLYAVAMADGTFTPEEQQTFMLCLMAYGFTQEELQNVIDRMSHESPADIAASLG